MAHATPARPEPRAAASSLSPLGPIRRLRSAPTWIAVVLATLTIFGPLSMDLYLPVLPALAADLASTTSAAQLTMTACLLGLAFGQLIAGPISDRFGRRRPLIVGLIVYTAASALCVASGSVTVLIGFRLIQGLAGGVGLVIAQACGRDIYEGPSLARYYGRIVVLSGLAAIVAPVIGGLLAAVMGWRGIFVVLAVIGAIVTVAVVVAFDETLHPARRVGGGFRELARHVGVLRRDRLFVGATLSSALTSAAYFAYLASAPFVLGAIYGLNPPQVAIAFGINAAGFAAFGFGAGRAVERWGERRVFGAGLTILGLGAGLLVACAVVALPLSAAVAAFFLVAAGAAAVSPPSTTLALVDHPQRAGTASSILGVARFGAGGIAAPLVGLSGEDNMASLAVVVAVTCAAAVVTYRWLVLPTRT